MFSNVLVLFANEHDEYHMLIQEDLSTDSYDPGTQELMHHDPGFPAIASLHFDTAFRNTCLKRQVIRNDIVLQSRKVSIRLNMWMRPQKDILLLGQISPE